MTRGGHYTPLSPIVGAYTVLRKLDFKTTAKYYVGPLYPGQLIAPTPRNGSLEEEVSVAK